MNSATDPMLESLALCYPLGLRISDIHQNLSSIDSDVPSENTFYRARDECLEHGFIERMDTDADLFRITDEGIEYLEGEIEALDFETRFSPEDR